MHRPSNLGSFLFVFSLNENLLSNYHQLSIVQVPGKTHSNTSLCVCVCVCVPISSAAHFPFKHSAECWINWHWCSHMKGPSRVEGCACQNLILWIVSWCCMCSPWFLSGLWNVFIQGGESPSCPWLPSLCWASFLGMASPSSVWSKGKFGMSALGSSGLTEDVSSALLWGRVDLWQSGENLSWGEIGHDLPLAGATWVWPEVIEVSTERWEWRILGGLFFYPPVSSKEMFYLVC